MPQSEEYALWHSLCNFYRSHSSRFFFSDWGCEAVLAEADSEQLPALSEVLLPANFHQPLFPKHHKFYDRKYPDMEERLYKLYEEIDSVEVQIKEVETRILNVRRQKISGDNIYQFLLYFDRLYDKFTYAEKKTFLSRTS